MSSIAAGKLISNALVHTSDRVGELVFKTNGTTTALTLDSAQDATFVGNVTIAGDLSVTGGSSGITIDLEDNKKLNLGNSNDMQIYHDGSNSIIADNGTGALILYGSDIILQKSGSSERLADFAQDGAARLYYDNGIKLKTSTTGVDFTAGITEEHVAVTSSSNSTIVDCTDATSFSHTLTENTTFTFNNPSASGTATTFILKLIQDASASGYTVTWPSSVDWPSATAPTLTATASAVDYFMFTTNDGGTTWYGFTAGQAMG
jgi:hypothetical protein